MSQKVDSKLEKMPEDKKQLWTMRHSAEHILMQAMENLGYKLHKAMGPATDDGFYFDFELLDGQKISEEELPKIEKEMVKIRKRSLPFNRKELNASEARELFADNPYKLEWIDEAESRNEPITVYWTGPEGEQNSFVDLCAGPHVANTGKVGPFKLLSIAGAYWRGDEKNKMLTRIYGTAYPDQESLDAYLHMLEEAQKRDHRKLAQDLEIYTTSDEVGQGLVLWLPNGAILRDEMETWAHQVEKEWGYQHVYTPHITKKELYEISGHLPYYSEDLYSPLDIEGEEYYLKPMNCPHHHMIYKSKLRSYKELPVRLSEYGHVYRFERSGSLHGLMRVRGFAQNDAHIYVKPEQAVEEFVSVMKMHEYYYDALGIDSWWVVLGVRDPENLRQKYHGDDSMWDEAEKLTKQALDEAGVSYELDEGGAAHYGPKGDIFVKSVIGKEYAIGTTQLDLFMPERFGLKYVDENGEEVQPYVIHRAPLGSHERMIGFLLEHFAGAMPVWMHPTQVVILPVSRDHEDAAHTVMEQIKDIVPQARVEVDATETLQKRIRNAQLKKTPYMLIIGNREIENESVNIRLRTEEEKGESKVAEFAEHLKEIIDSRSLGL